jgi:hypothetical protein
MKPLISFASILVVASTAAAQQSLDAFADKLTWKTNGPLITPPSGSDWHSIKDPSVVRFDGNWHVFCTLRGTKRSHATGYLRFKGWSDAAKADLTVLPNYSGFFCAPQVFYFTPHKKWYLICQAVNNEWDPMYQPAFCTNTDISKPEVKSWLDFWIICDDAKAHLFYTSMDGKMWRSETTIAKFPHGWSDPAVALEGDIFEASHTYRLKGTGKFVTVVEAQNGHGWRYFKSYVANKLEGPWIAVAAEKDRALASMKNVDQSGRKWTDSVSHGELIRTGHDEKLEVDPESVQFLIQGVLDADRRDKKYGEIPWRLGLLERSKK